MTKSDRTRVLEALDRWEARHQKAYDDPNATASQVLGAAVDWLRAMTKLAEEYLDPEDTGWPEGKIVDAAMLVRSVCRDFAGEIRDEAKNL